MSGRRLKAGFYRDATKIKSAIPRLHQSIANVLVSRSPLHGWHKAFREEPEPFDDARNFGQVAHELKSILLGPQSIVTIASNDWRTMAAREQRDEALAAGKLPVLERRFAEAQKLLEILRLELDRREIALSGESELTALWRAQNGVWCEGRMDHFIRPAKNATAKNALIYDFKFMTSNATLRTCESRCIENGYDIQHAAYVEAAETILPELAGRVKMQFVFVEVEPPNAVRIAPLAGSMRTSGQWRWAKAQRIWRECMENFGPAKPWPNYEDDGVSLECPAWALREQITEGQDFGRLSIDGD